VNAKGRRQTGLSSRADTGSVAARPTGIPFSALEEAQLRRLTNEAWDLKESPYFDDALRAIVDFHERTLPDRLEREARRYQ
jgi:hypothetical protein